MRNEDPDERLSQPRAITDLLLYRFHRVLGVGGGLVTRLCEGEFGVTRRQWRVLAMVAVHGPVSSSELARRSNLDRPTTSKAIGELVAKGLIQRPQRPGDARFAELALTDCGRQLYDRMFPAVRGVSLELLAPLSDAEVVLLDSMLERIQAHGDALASHSTLPPADRRGGGSRRGAGVARE
jgi:DNA-binding MarR family transcriptional regulator